MPKHQISNNYIYVIQEIKILSFLKLIISDNNILIAQDLSIIKEIAHLHILLLLLVQLLIDGADLMISLSQFYHHKVHWLVIKLLIINVKEDTSQEHQIMQKYMDQFNNHVLHIILKFRHHNNVKKKLNHAKNIKLLTIVYQKTFKILNNKFSITGQLLQSFQFIEISLYTKKVFIKFIQEIKDFQLAKQLKLSVGM